MTFYGHVMPGSSPDPDYHGATLTADLAIGDTVLHVDDTADFDEDPGDLGAFLMLGLDLASDGTLDLSAASVLSYDTCDEDASTVTLSAPSSVASSAGDRIYVRDPVSGTPVVDYYVMVSLDDGDTTGDALLVTLGHGLSVDIGSASDLSGQSIAFEEDDDGELVATDLPGSSRTVGKVAGFQDSVTAAGPGDIDIPLTYRPIPGSTVHAYWGGLFQDDDQWTLDLEAQTVTLHDTDGVIRAGQVVMAKYLYDDPTTKRAGCVTVAPTTGTDSFIYFHPYDGTSVLTRYYPATDGDPYAGDSYESPTYPFSLSPLDGSGSVLADGDDATGYNLARIGDTGGVPSAFTYSLQSQTALPVVAGAPTVLTVNFRARGHNEMSDGTLDADATGTDVVICNDDQSFYLYHSVNDIPDDNTFHDYTWTFNSDDETNSGVTIADAIALLQSGAAFISFSPNSGHIGGSSSTPRRWNLFVSEASVVACP